jgi:hypothetical protein
MTHIARANLSDSIRDVAAANPGITTNMLCREVRVRKSDVLAELEALRREQLLRFESGCRGSKCWYVVGGQGNQFLAGFRGVGSNGSDAEVGGKR